MKGAAPYHVVHAPTRAGRQPWAVMVRARPHDLLVARFADQSEAEDAAARMNARAQELDQVDP